MEIDTGTQTRLLHFGRAGPGRDRSVLAGVFDRGVADARRRSRAPPPASRASASSRWSRRTCGPGYLRKNGVPYGAGAVLTEYVEHLKDDDGSEYLAITTMLEDPQYLHAAVGQNQSVQEAGGRQGLESDAVLGEVRHNRRERRGR